MLVKLVVGFAVGLAFSLAPARTHAAEIVINEILADNQSIAPLADYPDYFPDYVELYNGSARDIDLAAEGWSLSTKKSPSITDFKDHFFFPAGTILDVDSNLLVFFDNKTNFPGIHTTWSKGGTNVQFSLKRTGDRVLLFKGNATSLVDSNIFGLQLPDYSIGRFPDFTGNFTLTYPSPCPCTPKYPPTNTPVSFALAPAVSNAFSLKINEWLATNSAGADKDWFEVYNPDTNIVELSGLVFVDKLGNLGTARAIPPLSYIAPQGFVQVFASDNKDPAAPANEVAFSISSSNGDDLFMFAPDRATELDYVRSSLISSNNNGRFKNISEGRVPDGGDTIIQLPKLSPEASNFGGITNVVINEVLSHTDLPLEDAIEFYNPGNAPFDISNYWLSNNRDVPKKYHLPVGTIVPAHGFKVIYEGRGTASGFNKNATGSFPEFTFNSANGDEAWLFSATANGKLTGFRVGVAFGPAQNGVSFGRYLTTDGRAEFVAMSTLSFGTSVTAADPPGQLTVFRTGTGAPNPGPRIGPIVINEIHYHPKDIGPQLLDDSTNEFVELVNISRITVPLFDPNVYTADRDYSSSETADHTSLRQGEIYADGRTNSWRLRGMVDLDFPLNITLGHGKLLLLVNFDPVADPARLAAFRAKYGVTPDVQVFGPYRGKLSNGGGSVQLLRPDPPQGPQHPDFHLVPHILIDEVKYSDKAPWPVGLIADGTSPDGGGASLQRISALAFGNDPANWKAANPTAGRPNSTDTQPPVLQITAPTAIILTNQTVTVVGKSSDNVGVSSVFYSLNGSSFLSATGSLTWSIWGSPELTLNPGTNTISAYAVDQLDNVSVTNSRKYFVSMRAPLGLSTNGHGAVKGATDGQRLEVGRNFTLTAVPAAGQFFSNWIVSTGIGLPDIRTSPVLTYLMASNLAITASFTTNPFIAAAGAFNGLFLHASDPDAVQYTNSGFFNLVLTSRGTYTAKLTLGARKIATGGQFDLLGNAQNILNTSSNQITINWAMDLAATDRVLGTISDGFWTAQIEGDRAVFNATHPCPNAGKYTFAILGWPGATNAPAGHGFGTITVAAGGVAKLAGSLADKTKATQSVPLSKDGLMPLYIPQVKGALISWVAFTNRTSDDLNGVLTWNKLANSATPFYPAGFSEQTTLIGSRYTAPLTTNRILTLSTGQAIFADGNLAHGYTNDFLLGPSSKFTNQSPEAMTLSFTVSSGLFKGTFMPAGNTKPLAFNGAVLQKGTNGLGSIIGTNQSSSVTLQPAP